MPEETPAPAAKPAPPAPAAKSVVKVKVLVNNLGPKLYQAGAVTDDAEIVALLDDPRKLVEKVK
jgi:hypothetical protein